MQGFTKASWAIWFVTAVISLVYIIFAAKSFRVHGKIQEISEYIDGSDEKKWVEKGARGGRAACVLSMMAVIAYAGYTLTYIIKDWATNGALNGTMFGILITSSLYSSAFMLLVGVVLQGNDYLIDIAAKVNSASDWQKENEVTFAMAYLLTGIYGLLLLFHIIAGIASPNNPMVAVDRTVSSRSEPFFIHRESSPSLL